VLVVVGVVVALVAVANGGSASPKHASAQTPTVASKPNANTNTTRPRPARHPRPVALDAESRAIDRVLAYTPFITGGTARHRVVALTFDDGPSPYTPGIIRQLDRLHVPATFFVVGQQLNDFSGALRDELARGFVIGDHTENHAPLNALSEARQYSQIHDVAGRMTRAGAPFPRLFRPPYGVYNRTTLSLLHRFRMLMVLWSVDPRDWTRPGTPAIVQRVLAGARPGAIIELHDGGGDRSETEAALPAIVKALRRRHYGFVTVPELLRIDPPRHGQRLPNLAE
jgi:peptidoglycan/xylan/chitin deacetylase (PgdA/CDA1 family)